MERAAEATDVTSKGPSGTANRAVEARSLRTRLGEIAINLSVIAVLAVAAQQSVAGFRVVQGSHQALFAPHQEAQPLVGGARPAPAAEIVFGPDGSLLRATSITVTDTRGNSKTITFGPTGEPIVL